MILEEAKEILKKGYIVRYIGNIEALRGYKYQISELVLYKSKEDIKILAHLKELAINSYASYVDLEDIERV